MCSYLSSLSSPEIQVSIFKLDDIPMFNADLENDLPQVITQLINELKSADAVIISAPEYNNMIPSVLKNTIDWLSRSYAKDSIRNTYSYSWRK